jgi:chromosome segregation ATPase
MVTKHDDMRTSLDIAQQNIRTLHSHLSELNVQRDELKTRCKELSTLNDKSKRCCDDLKLENDELTLEIAQAHSKCKELEILIEKQDSLEDILK